MITISGVSTATSITMVITDENNDWVHLVDGIRMLADIQELASDQFKGRYPGTEGEELTLDYINNQLNDLEVTALTDRNDLRQPFYIDPWIMPITPINLTIDDEELIYSQDYTDLLYTGNSSITTPTDIIFAGYGISALNFNFDDYTDLNVTGKIVVVCRGAPDGIPYAPYGYFGYKAKTAFLKGADGLIVFSHPQSGTDDFIKGTITPYNFVQGLGSVSVNRTTLERFGLDVSSWITEIDAIASSGAQYQGSKSHVTGIKGTLEVTTLYEQNVEGANVIAKFQGSASGSSDRALIISAHHDHVGESLLGEVYYGADDDASGVAVVLEVARVLNELYKNNSFIKTVIFALWGAEEMGLLGAYHYTKNPPFPLGQTDLVIQHDMVGLGPIDGTLVVDGGRNLPTGMIQDIRDAALQYGNVQSVTTNDHGSSDHAAFMEEEVNAVNFFWDDISEHPYYHTPLDTVDLIKTEILEKVALTTLGYIIDAQNLLTGSSGTTNTSSTVSVSPQIIIVSILSVMVVRNWSRKKKDVETTD
jgi:hypothetical protein